MNPRIRLARAKIALNQLKRPGMPKSVSVIPDVKMNPTHGRQIADAYDALEHNPNDPAVKESYDALTSETLDQFNTLKKEGFEFTKIKPGEKPQTVDEIFTDIQNKKLKYFPSEQGFGKGDLGDHPMLKPSGIKDEEGNDIPHNDIFRIVHDIQGHGVAGSDFSPEGEHKAFLTHRNQFSEKAHPALFTETAGQANWGAYNKKSGESNRKLIEAGRENELEFAEQKAGILPEEITKGKWHEAQQRVALNLPDHEGLDDGTLDKTLNLLNSGGADASKFRKKPKILNPPREKLKGKSQSEKKLEVSLSRQDGLDKLNNDESFFGLQTFEDTDNMLALKDKKLNEENFLGVTRAVKFNPRKNRISRAKLSAMNQKVAVRFTSSFGPDLDAINAFKKGENYQGYTGKGKNRKLKFEVKDGVLKLHGHPIATKTKKGIVVSNAGFDTGLTYSSLKELGINAKRTPGGKALLHNKEIDAVSGEKVLVPFSEVSDKPIRATKTKKRVDPRRTVTEQSQFREKVLNKELKEQGTRQLPLASTQIQPKDQKQINKITGVKSPLPKPTRATDAHHILPVHKYPGLRNNLNNAIMLTRKEHKEIEKLNPALLRKSAKLKKQLLAARLKAFTHSSSFVGNMRYDQDEQSMTGILSGKHYKWCDVSEREFDAFQGAGSKGAFFNRNIKGQHDCGSGGILSDVKSRISKLQKTALFGNNPNDPDNAVRSADPDTQRKMNEIEYPLVKKVKQDRESKFTKFNKQINKNSTREVFRDNMPNIPASRVVGTAPDERSSELDVKIRDDTEMENFKPNPNITEEEIEKQIAPALRGPFDKKHLHPQEGDVDVDVEEEWNLDEMHEGADFESKTTTSVNDKTMAKIHSLLEEAEVTGDPRFREQAKIKLMQYMPLGDNNPDDMLDFILDQGIEGMSDRNIFAVSRKNAEKFSKLNIKRAKLKIAGIKPLVRKKKKGRAIRKVSVKKAMVQTARKTIIDDINVEFLKHPLRKHQKGGFTYNPIDSEFLDASDRNQALKIRDVFKADKNKPFGIAAITDTKKGTTPISDPVQILGETKYLEQKGHIPIWGGYKGSYEVGFGIKGTHEDILKQTPKTQESALVIDPDGTSYLLYKEDGKKEKITTDKGNIQTAKMISADGIANKFQEFMRNNDISKLRGTFDPVNMIVIDATNSQGAIDLQRLFESKSGKVGFNSITDTRQGPVTDLEIIRSQLREIEQTGAQPSIGLFDGSLEANKVLVDVSDDEILADLLESQRSTGIIDENTQFRIVDNPKYRDG